MAKIIDGTHLFRSGYNPIRELEERIEFYRNFLLLHEGIQGFRDYYLTFHTGLSPDDEFVSIYCPHCGYILNDSTMAQRKVWVHAKENVEGDLQDRANWGILEAVCPNCDKKTIVILE